jgi:hypothetical protein
MILLPWPFCWYFVGDLGPLLLFSGLASDFCASWDTKTRKLRLLPRADFGSPLNLLVLVNRLFDKR